MRCRVRWSSAAVLYCPNDRCYPVTGTTMGTLLSAACGSGSRRTKPAGASVSAATGNAMGPFSPGLSKS